MLRAFRLVSSAVALACFATAATSAHAFLTYKQGERAKSANAAYAPAKAQVDLTALFGGSETAKSATTLTLQLPSGKRYEVARARILAGAEGGRTFVGYFTQYGEDYRVFVTEQQGVMTGYMLSPEGQIEIAPQVNGIAGEALVTSRTKAGLVRAFSFAPDGILTPHGQAAFDRAQAFGSANSLISADQLAKATERAKAGAQVTVDVLVAYTPGMTTRQGSAAGVLSRLNTLVALMNDALTQSQVTLTMRLVNATQVNYSDVGTNTAALDAISPGSTNALKATIDGLRNQHNADIVALMRPYQRSSHGGCGLAWILGSGSSGISGSDSSYAFSAISDGSDTAGSGYFCEDVSFAHEIGHNLGLLHDRANASGTGSTNYAFGYIDASAGFGTIMSYYTGARLSRYSNPNVTCNGVPCGKPNTASDSANAAGAISAGMAVVAGFRVAAIPSSTTDTDGDGIPDSVEPSLGRQIALKDNDVFTQSNLFVMQQYRDFLSREADAGGLAYWSNVISTGAQTRGELIQGFFNSAEFQSGIAPISRLYLGFFNRTPDHAGLSSLAIAARAGLPLISISNSFASSAEFQSLYGTLSNAQFVSLIYQNVLGRTADAGGYNYWLNQLNGGVSRGQVMLGFTESGEYVGKTRNKVFVIMMYEGMLRRQADIGGYDYWVGYINAGNSGLALTSGFLTAPEYRSRFLP